VNQNQSKDYLFDHLVIIGRDKLETLAQIFSAQGFQLTPLAHHNLGSINQLIMLDSTYIELLGWQSDKPVQRAEIANQAIGLDALVFRTNDAEKTYQQLLAKGFSVNPVQNLSRESEFLGKSVLVEFKTVRFSKQPIPGIRIYFCEHLSPEYVWQDQWLLHHNQITYLKQIVIASPDFEGNTQLLSEMLHLSKEHVITNEEFTQLVLPNIELNIQKVPHLNEARILSAQLCKTPLDPVDLFIDSHFLKNI
jgi:hypothetical protein